jgi:hypothetical protein
MSDYVTGLRADLVEAAGRHQRRGALARTAVPLRPRAWSRPALAAALATAACVAAVTIAVRAVGPPTPAPTQPHRVVSVPLGTEGFDAVYAAGCLWVAGTNGEVIRVAHGRVVNRVKVGQQAKSISVDGDSVWVTTSDEVGAGGALRAHLVQLDARTGEIRQKIPFTTTDVGPVEAGAGGLWFVPDDSQSRDLLERRDPATGRRVGSVRSDFTNGLAAGPELLWGIRRDGAVGEIDPRADRVVAEVPAVHENGPAQNGPGPTSLAPEGDGVWVAGGARGDVAWVQAGSIARRIRIGEGNVFAVARTRDALWVALGTGTLRIRYRVVRIDPETGRRTATVQLGYLRPTVLTPAGRDLWIVTLGGSATLIR